MHRIKPLLPVLLLVLSASTGSAQTTLSRLWTGCGGNIFNTCASVELTIFGDVITVRSLNLSGSAGSNTYGGTIFTGIGFDNLNIAAVYDVMHAGKLVAASTVMTGPWLSGVKPNPWIARNDRAIGGGFDLDVVGTTTNGIGDGIASDCAAAGQLPAGTHGFWSSYTACGGAYAVTNPGANGGWVSFSFHIQPVALTQADLDNATLLVKGQNGPAGGSTEFACGPGQCLPPAVTPEPATVLLLATGLIGIGGAARRRRRKTDATLNDPS